MAYNEVHARREDRIGSDRNWQSALSDVRVRSLLISAIRWGSSNTSQLSPELDHFIGHPSPSPFHRLTIRIDGALFINAARPAMNHTSIFAISRR